MKKINFKHELGKSLDFSGLTKSILLPCTAALLFISGVIVGDYMNNPPSYSDASLIQYSLLIQPYLTLFYIFFAVYNSCFMLFYTIKKNEDKIRIYASNVLVVIGFSLILSIFKLLP